MKKLIIKIGNEKHELPYNGGTFSFEVSEKYVPKVGDCVKVECRNPNKNSFYWFKVKEFTNTMVDFSLAIGENLTVTKDGFFNRDNSRVYTQITPEELKAKYAEAGYDWDYESDTVKPIKWMPEVGDECWRLDIFYVPAMVIFDTQFERLRLMAEGGFLFQTEEKAKEFSEHCLKYFDKK